MVSNQHENHREGGQKKKKKSSWFPKASYIKTVKNDTENGIENKNLSVTILLFYQYMRPLWSEGRKNEAITFLEKLCINLNLGGRIRVSIEGLNSTISGSYKSCRDFAEALSSFDQRFKDTDFKYIDNLSTDRAFKDVKVLPVKELVFYGIPAGEELGEGGTHLPPREFHKKLAEDNTVIIDVRNAYESDIGRFGKQEKEGGAALILPKMRKSTDFIDWIKSKETKEKIEGKEVLMYCTGGVRCERASAFLKKEYGDKVTGVYQLHGGIEKYLQEYEDGGFWQGKNFVFDKREAVGVDCLNGVGGILTSNKSIKKNKNEKEGNKKKRKMEKERKSKEESNILGRCAVCDIPWDRYIGKKKCDTCAVPVLICQDCSTRIGENKNKKGDQHDEHNNGLPGINLIRCPLCKEENCVVRAGEVQLTNNGKQSKKRMSGSNIESLNMAKTVLKWGGGHSRKKHKKK